jgi:hypothetical protein
MRNFSLSVIGWLALTSTVHAQPNWQTVMGLPPEQTVRVRAIDGRGATGRVFSIDQATIEVLTRFKDVARFRREDVQLVEKLVGDPDAKKRGAKKGFLWGVLLSALGTIGPMMADGPSKLPYVYGTFVGGGAAIGALTAESSPTWIVVYRI